MNSEIFIPAELWREIKTYLFHNIKLQGKHLKKNTENLNYNSVMTEMPGKYEPRIGPKIVYNSATKKFRIARFVYLLPSPSRLKNSNSDNRRLIVEHLSIKNIYSNKSLCMCHFNNPNPICQRNIIEKIYSEGVIGTMY